MPMKRSGCAFTSSRDAVVLDGGRRGRRAPAPGRTDRSAASPTAHERRPRPHPCRRAGARYPRRRAETAGRACRRPRTPPHRPTTLHCPACRGHRSASASGRSRHLLLQDPDVSFGKHMGMGVDRPRHCLSPGVARLLAHKRPGACKVWKACATWHGPPRRGLFSQRQFSAIKSPQTCQDHPSKDLRNRAWTPRRTTDDHRAAYPWPRRGRALVRGRGRYMADAPLPNQAYALFRPLAARLRPHRQHRRRRGANAPGVIGVLTGQGFRGRRQYRPPSAGARARRQDAGHAAPAGARRASASCISASRSRWWSPRPQPPRRMPPNWSSVEYESLTPVIDAREALAAGAPQLWPQAPGNIAVDWPGPHADAEANAREVERMFASAKYVARVAVMNQRMVGQSRWSRAAPPRATTRRPTATPLRACSQSAGAMRENILAIMGLAEGARARHHRGCRRRVRHSRPAPIRKTSRCMVGAKKLGRPIALDVDAVRGVPQRQPGPRYLYRRRSSRSTRRANSWRCGCATSANLGAYIGSVGANIPTMNFTRCLPGMYDIKHIDMSAKCVFTNTIPTAPYRGAGRPEASYVLERVVDEAARVTGIDPIKLRRRNLIKKSAMPYKTAVGTTYDSGDFEPILDQALKLADHDGFKQRRREAQKRGKYRGFGICCLLEHAGGAPLESATADVPRQRDAAAQPQCAEYRPGPCHGVSARHRRTARHSGGKDPASARRLVARTARLRLGRFALGNDRRPFAGEGDRHDPGKGKPIAAAMLEAGEGRHRLQGRPLRSRRHRSPRVAVRSRRPRRRDEKARRDRRESRHQDHDGDAAELSPTASISPRSRSIRKPATWRSLPIRRWTIAARRSIT